MNLTIGQYYPADSVIHKLDARTKILATIIYIAALFLAKGIVGYGLCILLLIGIIKLCKVPFKMMLSGLKSIIAIIIFTVVLNMLFIRTGQVVFALGIVKVTMDGIIISAKLCIRLVMLVLGSSVLTLVTSPIALTEGIEALLKLTKKIGVPAHEIAMMMSIALRFIPTLIDELDKIKKAQMARGADFDTGGLVAKAKSMIPLLVPLFVSAFRRADELAMAMEARCYRGDVNRTKMRQLKYGKNDFIAYGIVVGVTVLIVLSRLFLGA